MKKIYEIRLVLEEIKKFPQTYNTILGEKYNDKTLQVILRRKLNKLVKEGDVCCSGIPGTRFGKKIFYYIPKKYFILIEAGRIGSNVYVFFNYKRIGRFYLGLDVFWELKNGMWFKNQNKKIFEGNVLRWL